MPYNIESVVDSAVIEILETQKKLNLMTAKIIELEEKINKLAYEVSRLNDDGK